MKIGVRAIATVIGSGFDNKSKDMLDVKSSVNVLIGTIESKEFNRINGKINAPENEIR